MFDQNWNNSDYGLVYQVLVRSLESDARNIAQGTEATIGRAIYHFWSRGDRETVALLQAMAMTTFRLQHALRLNDESEYRLQRYALRSMARDWLLCAPMFPAVEAPEALAA